MHVGPTRFVHATQIALQTAESRKQPVQLMCPFRKRKGARGCVQKSFNRAGHIAVN
jgi:hypothetical protein